MMTTLQRFYSRFGTVTQSFSVSSNGTDNTITFLGHDNDPLQIEIVIRGLDDFELFLRQLHDMGMALVESQRARLAAQATPGKSSRSRKSGRSR